MNTYEQLKEAFDGQEGKMVTRQEIQRVMQNTYSRNPTSILPSDYCYNRWNKGIPFTEHLFEYLMRNTYKYIGEHASYTGLIYRKLKGTATEEVVGEWKNGVKTMYAKEGLDSISVAQYKQLYEEYLRVLRYELNVLQCRPTELRHLIGRIGELLCAIQTGGQLARETNQHGFDVRRENIRISVKTTAQEKGFVVFNRKTFQLLEEVFIVQYQQDEFHVIYHGDKSLIEQIARIYGDAYEVDIEKVRKLGEQGLLEGGCMVE